MGLICNKGRVNMKISVFLALYIIVFRPPTMSRGNLCRLLSDFENWEGCLVDFHKDEKKKNQFFFKCLDNRVLNMELSSKIG